MIVVSKPNGAAAGQRYMVAEALRNTLRIARTDHPAAAHAIAVEWGMRQYKLTPGELRKIQNPEVKHG